VLLQSGFEIEAVEPSGVGRKKILGFCKGKDLISEFCKIQVSSFASLQSYPLIQD